MTDWIPAVASLFSPRWCSCWYTFGLGAVAQSASLPWHDGACVDRLTVWQTFEVTLKWQRPDWRDYFSVYCHDRKTECTGSGARQKQITARMQLIYLGFYANKMTSVYSKKRLLMTAEGSGSTAMCLKCQGSPQALAASLPFINFSIKGIGLPQSSSINC